MVTKKKAAKKVTTTVKMKAKFVMSRSDIAMRLADIRVALEDIDTCDMAPNDVADVLNDLVNELYSDESAVEERVDDFNW